MKKLLSYFVITLMAALPLLGAENGDNAFSKTWEMTVGTNDHDLWEVDHLPDLDNDGMDEILACADEGGITLYLFESTGDNTYDVVWTQNIPDVVYSYTLSYGDLDNDGLGEIVVGANADAGQDAIWIYEWDGVDGSDNYEFQTSWSVIDGGGAGITALNVSDLDGDGIDEMFIGETAYDDFYVVQLDTNSSYDFPQWNKEMTDSLYNASDYSPWGFTSGDFDGDGKLEFASVEWDYNGLVVFQADGINTYSRETWLNDMTWPDDGSTLRSLSSSDLDGNGYMEIIMPSSNGRLYILTNDGDMAAIDTSNYESYLSRVYTDTTHTWAGGSFGNADMFYPGLGQPDIYVTRDVAGMSKVYDFEFVGDDPMDSLSYDMYEVASDAGVQEYQDVAVGNWDNDNQPELAVISTGGQSIQIFEHDPPDSSGFTQIATFDSSEYFYQIRGISAGSDLDQDGKPEVMFTDYRDGDHIHVFEVTGDNTLEWVYSTPSANISSGSRYVRSVTTGDLDNDGIGEIIYSVGGTGGVEDSAGVQIYEWDGSTDNGYTVYGHLTVDDSLVNDRWNNVDQMAVADIDGDGEQELMINNNGAAGMYDRCYILSVDGTFESTFYSQVTEGMWAKDTDEFGGSVVGATYGDTDGDGNMEAIFSVWDYGSLYIVEATGPDTYEPQNYLSLDYTGDGVFLDGVAVTDIDGDGKDEVYAPIYGGSELAVLNSGDDIAAATVADNVGYVRRTALGNWGGTAAADYDDDGIPELYGAQYDNYVYQYIFDGTDVMNPDAYTINAVETNPFSTPYGSFAVEAPGDLDGDGKGEVYVGHLSLVDGQNWLTVQESSGGTFVQEEWNIVTPNDYKLAQNYPNPFNPTTQIQFKLPLKKEVTLTVYDLMGRKVKTLINKTMVPGQYDVEWNGTNDVGHQVASGVYIYRLKAGNVVKSKKMTLIR